MLKSSGACCETAKSWKRLETMARSIVVSARKLQGAHDWRPRRFRTKNNAISELDHSIVLIAFRVMVVFLYFVQILLVFIYKFVVTFYGLFLWFKCIQGPFICHCLKHWPFLTGVTTTLVVNWQYNIYHVILFIVAYPTLRTCELHCWNLPCVVNILSFGTIYSNILFTVAMTCSHLLTLFVLLYDLELLFWIISCQINLRNSWLHHLFICLCLIEFYACFVWKL